MLDTFTQRRQAIASQVRDLINVRGPRTAAQKSTLAQLLREADELEGNISSEHERQKEAAFNRFVRFGERALSTEHRALLKEFRDMGTGGTGAYPDTSTALGMAGAYFAPLSFRTEVESALKYAGPMQDVSNLIETATGRLYPCPSDDDSSIAGEFISEGQAVSDTDVALITQEILGAYLVSSKMIRMSVSLLEDAGFDAPSYLAGRLGLRLGRAMEPMFTTGSGNGQPTGFITAAPQAAVALGAGENDGVSGANSIGSSDVAALEASVDYAYRQQDAVFQCHSTTLQAMRAQVNKQGALLYPGLQSAELRLLNYPLLVNPNMDQLQSEQSSPTVTRNVLAFGSFHHFSIRRTPLILKSLDERFAELRQVAFIAFYRVDSNLLDGGGGAVKYLTTVY